jgi:O-antigen chain-terminating methyltransferase
MTSKQKQDAEYLDWRASERLAALDQGAGEMASPSEALSREELYAPDGEAFVARAFCTFLRRAPTAEELAGHLAQLAAGVTKGALAASLRYSPEARQHKQRLNLDRERLLLTVARLPLIGRACHWLLAVLGASRSKRTLLAQQQAVARLRTLLDARSRGLSRDIIASHEVLSRELRDEIQALRAMTGELQSALGSLQPGVEGNSVDALDDGFYIAFEDHFRGAEDDIRERLGFYLPLIAQQLPADLASAPMADIGCGRGEWIGLMSEAGYVITGIDLNDRNVEACLAKGLTAIKGDGIAWLRQTASQSLGLISSFHVIEHLPLAQLNALLVEALRCLKPGGVLILETPNPENLVTAANRFYTDPTHRHPIPPDLTEFLLRHKGFADVNIHRLHPSPDSEKLAGDGEIERQLNALLHGPQDYAAIAVKR